MSVKSPEGRRRPLFRFALLFLLVLSFTLLPLFLLLPRKSEGAQNEENGAKKAAVLYLDPGHGDFDFGATATVEGGALLAEKELVLSLARDAAAILRARGYTVHLSREGDTRHTYTTSSAEVYARLTDAEEKGASHLISIHANAYAGEGRAYGARVYYDPAETGMEAAAARFADAVTRELGSRAMRACRTVADGSYAILRAQGAKCLLFECGFLSDDAERALLADTDYREALARAIAAGVEAIVEER